MRNVVTILCHVVRLNIHVPRWPNAYLEIFGTGSANHECKGENNRTKREEESLLVQMEAMVSHDDDDDDDDLHPSRIHVKRTMGSIPVNNEYSIKDMHELNGVYHVFRS
jgi:hypothetical protein